MEVQSVIFDRARFSLDEAKLWIRAHGFKATFYGKRPELLDRYYRFRQRNPKKYTNYRTMRAAPGIMFVLGRPL